MQCAKLTEGLYDTSYKEQNSVSIGKSNPVTNSPSKGDEITFTDKLYKAFGGNRNVSKVAPQMVSAMNNAIKNVTNNGNQNTYQVTATS